MKMNLGDYRVGISFNPSNNHAVDAFNRQTADLINDLHDMTAGADEEKLRLIGLAWDAYEEAAMWAVKAATKTPRE